jgi:AraC-like DNA-binding protein
MTVSIAKRLSVKQVVGFHTDTPLKDGATNVPLLPFSLGHAVPLWSSGTVLITEEKPPRVVGGIDAYTSALHQANERKIAVYVIVIFISASDLNAGFWSQWPVREIALARYHLRDRTSLLRRLLRTSHCSVMNLSIEELAERFDCSERSVKRVRQEAGASRTYIRRKTITEIPGTTI